MLNLYLLFYSPVCYQFVHVLPSEVAQSPCRYPFVQDSLSKNWISHNSHDYFPFQKKFFFCLFGHSLWQLFLTLFTSLSCNLSKGATPQLSSTCPRCDQRAGVPLKYHVWQAANLTYDTADHACLDLLCLFSHCTHFCFHLSLKGFQICVQVKEKKIKFPSTCSKIPLLQLFLGPCPLLPTELHCGIPDQISTVSGIQIKGCKLSHWHPHKVYQDVNIKFSGFNSCTWVRITSCISTAWEKQILSNDM